MRGRSRSLPRTSDTDLAAALGVVHGHLRLGQIELMRRISQGRIAETIGPLGVELDRTIHLMDLPRAVPGIVASLPRETLAWAEAFVAGLNHVIRAAPALPYECRLLGVRPAPFSLADFFVLARLVSADISWMVGARLLRARERAGPGWAVLWPKLVAAGAPPTLDEPNNAVADLLGSRVRGGSNAAAVAGFRTAHGSAMIASDRPWAAEQLADRRRALAGVRVRRADAVGHAVHGAGPQRPYCLGGTSLHAASSELIDVSQLPESDFTERRVTICVRGGGERVLRLPQSPFGPVVSDGMLLKSRTRLALRWGRPRAER
ncbi:MAG: penicillin acylase family protein [Rhodospirillales bacterium]